MQATEAYTTNVVPIRPPQPKRPMFPEIAHSPEMAVVLAIFSVLTPKQRRSATSGLMALAAKNAGTGVGAPNRACELLVMANHALDER